MDVENDIHIFYFIFLFISDSKSTILPIPIIGTPINTPETMPTISVSLSSNTPMNKNTIRSATATIPIAPVKYKTRGIVVLSSFVDSCFASSCLVSSDIKTLPFNIYTLYIDRY